MRRFLAVLIGLIGLWGSAFAQSGIGLPPDSRGGQEPKLTRPQLWPSAQLQPPQTLIDGSTIAVPPGSGSYFLTLLGTGHTISCPSGGLAAVRWLTFDIVQGAGGPAAGYQPVWDVCYGFPSFTPPTLTRDTGAVDTVSCYSVPASLGPMRCGSLNTVGYGFLVRNNHAAGALCSSTATCAVTISNSVSGDLRVVPLFWGGGSGGNPIAADITSMVDEHGNSCSEATGAFGTIPAGTRATDIWYCQVSVGAGSSTVTVTFGSNVPAFSGVFAVEAVGGALSGVDAGLGNHNSGTSASLSVASTGGTPQPQDWAVGMFKSEGGSGGTLTAGLNTILLDQNDSGSPDASAYQIPSASGTTPTLALTAGGSQGWSASIAIFKHK